MMYEVYNFYSRICGKLLGDGCVTKQEQRKPRFQFMHRTEDFGWTNYCYERLKDFIPLSAPVYQKVKDPRLVKGYSERYVVQSRTDEVITDLYKLWYPLGRKTLPLNFIKRHLDEQALAWWYQDDGHLKKMNGVVTKIILSTDSFSTEENSQLTEIIFDKFKLRFLTDGQNRLILYDQFQIIYFLHLVSPWLHESMSRKTMPEQPLRSIAQRTTIYLPSRLKLLKPTSDINEKLVRLDNLFDKSQKRVYPHIIFKLFNSKAMKKEDVKGYQIIIDEKHRKTLIIIRQQTGLTISQLAEYCFKI